MFVLQVERVVTIMQNPRQYKIPDWFLNRQKDVKDGKYSQVSDSRLYCGGNLQNFSGYCEIIYSGSAGQIKML